MKIIPKNSISINNIHASSSSQTFGQNTIVNNEHPAISSVPVDSTMSAINVKVPINYAKTEDIKLTDDLTAHCYKLANGQRVVIVPKDGETLIKSYVNTGSFNEPDHLRGISHFIEHNLFNGSEALGEKVFFDEVNKMGAYTNASTSFDKTDYFISSNLLEDTDLEEQIKLHAGMLQSPKFLVDKLEKEKKIVNSEINMCVSEDTNIGFSQTVKNLFNIQSSSLDLVAGSTNNISALTRDDIVKYYNNNYYPANTVTVITGEVDEQKTMDLVAKYFNSTKMPTSNRHFEKMTPIDKTVRQDIISKKTTSNLTSVFMGFAGPENNNTKDKIHLRALTYLAGGLYQSRFADLERKYGSSINIAPDRLSSRPTDKSIIIVEAGTSEEKSEQFLKDLYSTIHKLTQVPPTEDELTAIKNSLKKTNNMIFERSNALNFQIGSAMLNDDISQITDFNKIVDEMTATDIVNTAKKYLDLNKVALTVVHPSNVNAENITKNHKASNISFQGLNKKTPIDTSKIQIYRLANNMEVICNDTNSDNVEYRFDISEKNWTPKKAAVANVLSDILQNEDSKDMTVAQKGVFKDINGIDAGLSAGQYGISLSAEFPSGNTDIALDFFNKIIKNPKIDEETLQKSISRLKDIYESCEVSPRDKFAKIVYAGTPLAFTPKDKLESLNTITVDDVKNFYNEIFVKGIGTVSVSAPFSKNPQIKQSVFNALSNFDTLQQKNLELNKRFTPIEKTVVCTDVYKKNQAKIMAGYTFKRSKNMKDLNCVELLNEILGGSPSSRLFSDLRETRHLAYAVKSSYNYVDDMGVMILNIGTTTENKETGEKTFDNIKKSIDGFNDNIKKITTEKVTEEELAAAKKNLKTAILSNLETNAAKTSELLGDNASYYSVDFVNKQLENIDTITVDDIYNTANNIFKSKPIYSITATEESLENNKDFLASLEK